MTLRGEQGTHPEPSFPPEQHVGGDPLAEVERRIKAEIVTFGAAYSDSDPLRVGLIEGCRGALRIVREVRAGTAETPTGGHAPDAAHRVGSEREVAAVPPVGPDLRARIEAVRDKWEAVRFYEVAAMQLRNSFTAELTATCPTEGCVRTDEHPVGQCRGRDQS